MDARETSIRTEYMAMRLHEAYMLWVKAGRPARMTDARPRCGKGSQAIPERRKDGDGA